MERGHNGFRSCCYCRETDHQDGQSDGEGVDGLDVRDNREDGVPNQAP